MDDWAWRISRHLTADGSVVVPARIAAWLEQRAGLTGDRRIACVIPIPRLRGPQALHAAALNHRSGTGTKPTVAQAGRQESETWLTTTEAASYLALPTERFANGLPPAGFLPPGTAADG